MALEFAHGVVQWLNADVATTTYTVSGLSFQPKALRFYWNGVSGSVDTTDHTVHSRRGVGFATGTAARRCVATFDSDAAANADCGHAVLDDCIAGVINGAGAVIGKLGITAINSDGFTLTVDDNTPGDITVCWEAWGGADITVATVGDITEPAATGVQTYTVTGFTSGATDQVVMLAGCQSTAALGTAVAGSAGLSVGFASDTASANNIVIASSSKDTAATMDTDTHTQTGLCLAVIEPDGVGITGRATLTQFNTDNFGLDWLERKVTGRRSVFLAIKGGNWTAGAYTIAGDTLNATTTVGGLAYQPKGICAIGGRNVQSASDTVQNHSILGMGTGSSTSSRRSLGQRSTNGVADADIESCINYAALLAFPPNAGSGFLGATDLSALGVDGFTAITDNAGGVANEWQGYLVFGNAGTDSTVLYLRNTTENGIGSTYFDMLAAAGSSADTAVVNAAVAGTEVQWTKTAGGALVQWVSGRVPAGGYTLGRVDVSVWAKENDALTNIGGRLRVFKRTSGGTETEIGPGPFDDGVEFTTSDAEYTWTADVANTALSENDRVLVKLYITNIGVMATGTGTLTFNAADAATGDSFIAVYPAVTFKAEDQIIDVGLVSEVDTASAASAAKALDAGLTNETDTASAVSVAKTLSVGLASETDTAQAVSTAKALSVGLSSETDSVSSPSADKAYDAGMATETDTNFAVSVAKALSVGLAAETDQPQAVTSNAFPAVPFGLVATPISSSQIDLMWGNVVGASGYDIERDGVVIVEDNAGTTYSDMGLSADTTYDYRVRAVA